MKNILKSAVLLSIVAVTGFTQDYSDSKTKSSEKNFGAINGRAGFGFDASLSSINLGTGISRGLPGLSIVKSLESTLFVQGIFTPMLLQKQDGQDAQFTMDLSVRAFKSLANVESASLLLGAGITLIHNSPVDFTDLFVELPVRIEYFPAQRFSIALSGGLVWYPSLLEDTNGWTIGVAGGGVGSLAATLWL